MIKKYSLVLLTCLCSVLYGFGQIATQSFEAAGDTWTPLTFSTPPCTNGADRWDYSTTLSTITPNDGAQFWGIQDLNGTCGGTGFETISLPNVNVSAFTSVTFSFDYNVIGFDANDDIRYELFYDNVSQGSVLLVDGNSNLSTGGWLTETVNIPGTATNVRVILSVRQNGGGDYGALDNIVLDGMVACTPPADPNGGITGTTPACTSTTLTYTGTDTTPGVLENYWQASSTGTDQSNNAVSTFNATSTGTYYVRKYDVAADCWSANSVSHAVVIETSAPSVTTQPTNQSVYAPTTATFTITETGAVTYQWEVSTNGGANWNNVTGGSGANTASYTTGATNVGMNNNQYRCVITNPCGSTNSNAAILTVDVLADVVITEIMYNPPLANDYEWIEICNLNGTAQDISNYTVDVNNITRFTFPSSSTIPANSCITVLLGHLASSPAPECPFTPDYSNPVGTTNILTNGGATIELVADDAINVIDVVAYDDADDNTTAGNGSSFHVIDATMDNSDTVTNWQGVPDGGSPGDNTLMSPCTTFDPEINVEGNVGAFPDITDGDNTPQGTDNTLFATIPIGNSQTKSYRIQNTETIGDLIITGISITGTNSGDFFVDPSLVFPITVPASSLITFDVTFMPIASGQRNARVEIDNNDPDEDPYDYAIRGTGSCSASSISLSPNNGPVGTIVTVTGSNFGGATTATVNSIAASITVISATVIEVVIPVGADTSFLEITDESNCVVSEIFTVLTNDVTTCEGGITIPPTWTGLMVSGLFDNTSGSCHYLELFNPTASAINLTGYNIRLSNNQTNANDPFNYTSSAQPLSGTIAAESTFMVQFGNTGSTCSDCPNISPDIVITDSAFGINGTSSGSGGIDRVILLNGTTEIDMVANTDFASPGYVYLRNTTSSAPNTTFTNTDWTSQGTADCFGFQLPDFKVPPSVTTNPSASAVCDLTATLQVAGMEGSAGGNALAYQWYFSAPGDTTWTAVTNNATYSGATAATLNILNTLNVIDYQFYCQIRENDATCYESSEATRLDTQRTIWTGSWSNGVPDTSTIAVIDGLYNTSANGNINACQLVINSGANRTLNVDNSTFVRVVNNVINNGTLTVQTHGAFVQDGLGVAGSGTSGTFTNNGTATVLKQTELLNDWYEYTYWSSPVVAETIANAFPNTPTNRIFYFDVSNYLDQHTDGTTNGIPDDIDDAAPWDWQVASGNMAAGTGYAATSSPAGLYPGTDSASFSGEFNTGNISTSIDMNGFGGDNDWNFIGNPYAGAIDFDDVHSAHNTLIDGAAFLWSHALPPLEGNPGNEEWNFNQTDYAMITIGSGNIAGGSGVIPAPGNFIPSGQGFFVRALNSGSLTFTNSMRRANTTSNDQFFDPIDSPTLTNRLWLNLTSDNGVFNQILVAYVHGATDGNDGWSYDAPRNLSSGLASIIYTSIDGVENKKYAIQGKDVNSLTLEEIIPVGFKTTIQDATLYEFSIAQLEGDFLETNTIYLKDNYLDIIHNLSESNYAFTSDIGEFNDRFEIVFTEDALSVGEVDGNETSLNIIENPDGTVTFRLTGSLTMQSIEIRDILGRTVYRLSAENSSERTFDLSQLSQATYLAQVKLSNGLIITKKAIKRK